MCRVWVCLVGDKNTPEPIWDAPEVAFKMMVARTPNKLHSQLMEYSYTRRVELVRYETTDTLSRQTSVVLEANADAISARVFTNK